MIVFIERAIWAAAYPMERWGLVAGRTGRFPFGGMGRLEEIEERN